MNARALVGNVERVGIVAFNEASVQLLDVPTLDADVPTAAPPVSLFQINSTAITVSLIFVAEAIRSSAAAFIDIGMRACSTWVSAFFGDAGSLQSSRGAARSDRRE